MGGGSRRGSFSGGGSPVLEMVMSCFNQVCHCCRRRYLTSVLTLVSSQRQPRRGVPVRARPVVIQVASLRTRILDPKTWRTAGDPWRMVAGKPHQWLQCWFVTQTSWIMDSQKHVLEYPPCIGMIPAPKSFVNWWVVLICVCPWTSWLNPQLQQPVWA